MTSTPSLKYLHWSFENTQWLATVTRDRVRGASSPVMQNWRICSLFVHCYLTLFLYHVIHLIAAIKPTILVKIHSIVASCPPLLNKSYSPKTHPCKTPLWTQHPHSCLAGQPPATLKADVRVLFRTHSHVHWALRHFRLGITRHYVGFAIIPTFIKRML